MIRNQRYILSEMKPGDKFYLTTDKKKVAYQLSDIKPFEVKRQKGLFISHKYANCVLYNQANGIIEVQQFKADRYVIFLRNVN